MTKKILKFLVFRLTGYIKLLYRRNIFLRRALLTSYKIEEDEVR